ncbi:hypothetical protein EMIHUDRAFT_196105 [Emiliania huxleyi CCMP1516]|uniref:RNA-binding S4 domain-containing protein n=2 Tax=Emiliania huxleyi TaxID=2903 RepID=A0A0D3J3H5_EMIH1|nr:hypothetical protein EMIHUDRAFT_196105 [Emiliania huxleyi CCMP1516]EOD18060.1 hypothetical protein EMIHUDRAFT_196105 [Emiliania huxleyi CCMP1516]|eukprot:XP_005770489.1 hypothetical protein EMIHUDRAFT_196105 [Emiliania huxleyi CCMP1516]
MKVRSAQAIALDRSEDRKRQKGTLREADADPRLSPLLAFITEVVGPLGAPFWPASSAAAAPADISAAPDDLEEGEIALPLGSDESAQPEAEAPRAAAGATGTNGLLSNVTVSSNSGKTVYWQCTVCSARFRGRQSLADHTLAKKDPPHRRVAEADEFIRSCAETKAARKARDAAADLARVDDLLVQRGHCKTRGEAARLVQAGRVLTRKAAGQPQVLVKAVGLKLAHDAPFSLSDPAASWESEMALVNRPLKALIGHRAQVAAGDASAPPALAGPPVAEAAAGAEAVALVAESAPLAAARTSHLPALLAFIASRPGQRLRGSSGIAEFYKAHPEAKGQLPKLAQLAEQCPQIKIEVLKAGDPWLTLASPAPSAPPASAPQRGAAGSDLALFAADLDLVRRAAWCEERIGVPPSVMTAKTDLARRVDLLERSLGAASEGSLALRLGAIERLIQPEEAGRAGIEQHRATRTELKAADAAYNQIGPPPLPRGPPPSPFDVFPPLPRGPPPLASPHALPLNPLATPFFPSAGLSVASSRHRAKVSTHTTRTK